MICLFGHKWNGCKCTRCGKVREQGHKFQAGDDKWTDVCSICGATRTFSHKPEDGKDVVTLRRLVDTFAHYQSFSMDRTEETKIADELVAGGLESSNAIINYLLSCAQGGQKEGWWRNAAQLVRLLGRLPTVSHADDYRMLMRCQSTIWEFQTQVKDVAEQELLKLKKASPGYQDSGIVSAEDAHAELMRLDNIPVSNDARIKGAIAMKNSVESWSDDTKAFYYYIIGETLRQQNPKDERQYAFYAAQLFYNPASTSIGWIEFWKLEEFKELKPTPENAKMLHEKFPLLTSFDELIKPLPTVEDNSQILQSYKTYGNPDRATHIRMAVNDLNSICGSAMLGGGLESNREWIRNVAQDLYDAHGFSAMQEVFIAVKQRYPMLQGQLSSVWDGVGDWAD